MLERLGGAAGMDASDEAPDPREHLRVLQLGSATAAARIDRDAKSAERGHVNRRDHRYFMRSELRGELVLLRDLLVGPASRPIKLGHARRPFLHVHLVDAVLIAVEGEKTSVGAQAERRAGVE